MPSKDQAHYSTVTAESGTRPPILMSTDFITITHWFIGDRRTTGNLDIFFYMDYLLRNFA